MLTVFFWNCRRDAKKGERRKGGSLWENNDIIGTTMFIFENNRDGRTALAVRLEFPGHFEATNLRSGNWDQLLQHNKSNIRLNWLAFIIRLQIEKFRDSWCIASSINKHHVDEEDCTVRAPYTTPHQPFLTSILQVPLQAITQASSRLDSPPETMERASLVHTIIIWGEQERSWSPRAKSEKYHWISLHSTLITCLRHYTKRQRRSSKNGSTPIHISHPVHQEVSLLKGLMVNIAC